MPEKTFLTELYEFSLKILLPAFVGIGIKAAIEMKKTNTRVSAWNVFLSLIIGVGGAYISSDWVISIIDENWTSTVIALIAITSDKIGEFFIYKFNVDAFLTAVTDSFFDFLLNFKNKK